MQVVQSFFRVVGVAAFSVADFLNEILWIAAILVGILAVFDVVEWAWLYRLIGFWIFLFIVRFVSSLFVRIGVR